MAVTHGTKKHPRRTQHVRPTPKEVKRMLASSQWGQYQYYGVGERGIILATAGWVTSVEIEEGKRDSLSFRVRAVFAADMAHDGVNWARIERPSTRTSRDVVMDDVAVMFPANAIADAKFTANGRLVLLAAHPKEAVLLVLFPVGDAGESSDDFGISINKLDLTGIDAACTP